MSEENMPLRKLYGSPNYFNYGNKRLDDAWRISLVKSESRNLTAHGIEALTKQSQGFDAFSKNSF